MFDSLITFSLKNRAFVILTLVALVGAGVYSLLNLPIDAVPDITNTQVMALTSAPALGPVEVEQFITIPVENAMNGIPRIREVRSFTQFGISAVTIIFEEGTDIYWARQQVGERLVQVRAEIPPEFGQPEMGPIATGLGEIYQFEVRNAADSPQPRSLMELRTILDWEVARRLKSVPGVVEVNALGGELKTYEVELDPNLLQARGIALNRVFEAIRENNVNSGGGYIQSSNGELRVIRGVGLINRLSDLESVILDTTPSGTPIRVRDVGRVRFAPMIRPGAATRDGDGEAVTAIVYLLAGENGRVVVDRIKQKVEEIQKALPEGVEINAYYDRSVLINKTISTVAKNLAEGGVLVVVVLLIFLGNIKAGLVVAAAIPLSMLFAGNFMYLFGVAGSLMSLGAIDFGLIVDSAVIVIENCVSHLSHARKEANVRQVVRDAAIEVRRPVVFGVAIITMVHLPILALEGVEGKMFRPLALTVIFALTGSLLLSLTATPVLASFFLRPGMSEHDTLPIRLAKAIYEPILPRVLRHPILVTLTALGVFLGCIPIALSLGGEFIPRLDEGDFIIAQTRPPSTSLDEAIAEAGRLERALKKEFPDEIKAVVSRIGRPEIGLEAAGVNLTDTWVLVNEPSSWTRVHEKHELLEQVDELCKQIMPGCNYSFSQPIEMRFNEMLAGVRADLGIGVYGEDLNQLQKLANRIADVVRTVPGSTGIRAQVLGGLPFLRIEVDRDRIARYEINAADVLDAVAALGGKVVGQVVEGQRRFALQVRFGSQYRNDIEAIRTLKIADPRGRMIPLEDLAHIQIEDDTFEIWRKDRQRRIMVQTNVRDRDLAGFVAEVQQKVAEQVTLPRGYSLEWGGTFENLNSATKRLSLVIPLALGLIFLLLYSTFQSIKLGTLIFLSVPFATIGGVLALWIRGMNFSISAGVGFIALSGVAVLDGLVLVTSVRQTIENGVPMMEAIRRAAMGRLRPILMTATVASLGLLPMAIGHGAGAEVQRPLATVVIGGLMTAVMLQLLVLPSIYPWFDPGMPENEFEAEENTAGHQLARGEGGH